MMPAQPTNTMLRPNPGGFTLIEMVVVLVLIGMTAALAAPALLRSSRPESGFATLLGNAREAAIRRGETVHLRIGASGEWRIEGTVSGNPEVVFAGKVDPFHDSPLTILVSPTGSCALDATTAVTARDIHLDLLTCSVSPPARRSDTPKR